MSTAHTPAVAIHFRNKTPQALTINPFPYLSHRNLPQHIKAISNPDTSHTSHQHPRHVPHTHNSIPAVSHGPQMHTEPNPSRLPLVPQRAAEQHCNPARAGTGTTARLAHAQLQTRASGVPHRPPQSGTACEHRTARAHSTAWRQPPAGGGEREGPRGRGSSGGAAQGERGPGGGSSEGGAGATAAPGLAGEGARRAPQACTHRSRPLAYERREVISGDRESHQDRFAGMPRLDRSRCPDLSRDCAAHRCREIPHGVLEEHPSGQGARPCSHISHFVQERKRRWPYPAIRLMGERDKGARAGARASVLVPFPAVGRGGCRAVAHGRLLHIGCGQRMCDADVPQRRVAREEGEEVTPLRLTLRPRHVLRGLLWSLLLSGVRGAVGGWGGWSGGWSGPGAMRGRGRDLGGGGGGSRSAQCGGAACRCRRGCGWRRRGRGCRVGHGRRGGSCCDGVGRRGLGAMEGCGRGRGLGG